MNRNRGGKGPITQAPPSYRNTDPSAAMGPGLVGKPRWLCMLSWPSGREEIVLEDDMILNRQNILSLNPKLEGRDVPEIDQQVTITRLRRL